MTKARIQYFLDFIPLIILTIGAVNLIWIITTTDSVFVWKHIVALILLPLNYWLFYKDHQVGVIGLGGLLLLGLAGVLSFSPAIVTTTFTLSNSNGFQIPIFYGQPIFLLWLLLHFIVSVRFYFGVITKRYWTDLFKKIKEPKQPN